MKNRIMKPKQKKFWFCLMAVLLIGVLLSITRLTLAKGYKLFCSEFKSTNYTYFSNSDYCGTYYGSIYEWYQTDNPKHMHVEGSFYMSDDLTYKDGLWQYLNWPLQILWTDAIWQNALPQTLNGDYIQYSDLIKIDSNKDLIPDKIQEVNDLVVSAMEKEIFELKFNHPARQQGKYIVIKIDDDGWVEGLPSGVAGMADITEDGFGRITVDPYLAKPILEKTIAHELFHIIQFSYNPKFITDYLTLNFSEGTAMWMERLLFALDKYWYQKDYLDFFQAYYQSPQYSLYGLNTENKNFQYGTVLWAIFLEGKFKQNIIKEIWEEYFKETKYSGSFKNALYAATNNALRKRGSSIEEQYRSFARWIYDKDQYRRDTQAFPDVETYDVQTLPTEWVGVSNENESPRVLGSVYIKINTSKKNGDFYLNFVGASEAKWAVDLYSKNYLPSFSGIVPLGTKSPQQFVIPSQYVGSNVVAIISPIYSNYVETEENMSDRYYPFLIQAGFGTNLYVPKTDKKTHKTKDESNPSEMGPRDKNFCADRYGIYSEKDKLQDLCVCKSGYEWNQAGNYCVLKSTNTGSQNECGINAHKSKNGKYCICDKGFYGNAHVKCHPTCEDAYGVGSAKDKLGNFCICKKEYVWSVELQTCVNKGN